jgi:hypothetical protein
MKKAIDYFILICMAAACVSCDSLNQTAKSTYDDQAVFSNETLARYALNAIYESYVKMSSYRTDFLDGYGTNTDVDLNKEFTDIEKANFSQYKMSPTNSLYNNSSEEYLYSGNFQGIERANICIENLELYGDIDNRPKMGALYGEALTARALLYADLLNVYGEVPARFKPVTQETIYLPKSDKDVIYKQLLGDLLKAAQYMSWDQSLITVPGKACALGLYARLALQASGYSCRPDEGKVNTGAMGTVRKSNDPELQKEVLYPKALEALDNIINNAGLSLFDNFEDLWKWYCDLHTEYGKEVIFGLPFADNRGQHLTRNSVPNTKYNFGVNGGRIGPSPVLFYKYDKEDTRRDVTCVPHRYDGKGEPDWINISAGVWYNGKFRLEWMIKKPLETGGGEDGAKFTYLRYADILLMAAEIANELGDLEKAKSYMRPVLVRAYQSEELADAYLERLADKELFFDAIKDQRAFEFCGELLRRQDLIRWGCLKEALDQAKADMLNLKEQHGMWEGYNPYIFWRIEYNDPENPSAGYKEYIYGLQPGETENIAILEPDKGWTKRTYFTTLGQSRIDNLYLADPDMNMYRPIPAAIITANMGVLQNDYGYTF